MQEIMPINSYHIDSSLIKQAMQSTGLVNESDVIEQGLKLLIAFNAQQNLRQLRGKLIWDNDLQELRDTTHEPSL